MAQKTKKRNRPTAGAPKTGRGRPRDPDANRCKHVKPDGTRCMRHTHAQSGFCVVHDPARKAEWTAAIEKGRGVRTGTADLEAREPPKTESEVLGMLGEAPELGREGKIS